nr:RNA-directed DNA polymerase, eukaryota [Tanacetum cinerariifolium]
SNTLHNAIMEAGSKDRPPMLAPDNYVKWKTRIKRYIDTKPNDELIHYCLENPLYELGWKDKEVPTSKGSLVTRTERHLVITLSGNPESRDTLTPNLIMNLSTILENPLYELGWKDKEVPTSEGSLVTRTERVNETYKNVSQDIRDQLNAKAEAVQIILTGIDNDINSTVDACPNACEMNGTVAGARETVGSSVVQKSDIQCYNCKEFRHVTRECQKPKRAKDAAYHREKMLLCKQEEAGIQLNAEQAD